MYCLSGGVISSVLSSCQSTHYVAGTIEPKGLSVPASEFTYIKKEETLQRQFIIVHHDKLEAPIYLYKLNDNSYSALWMKCTHQGAELQASGDHLHCPSHGSEFDKNGKVTQGPADKNLRSFPVTVSGDKILIDLS